MDDKTEKQIEDDRPSGSESVVSDSDPIDKEDTKIKGITPLSLVGSLFAGAFGVQSKANRDRDFQHGKFHHFIIGGVVFAILFVLAVAGLVKLVMHYAVPT